LVFRLMLNFATGKLQIAVPSAVRALGNFINQVEPEWFETEIIQAINSGKCPGMPKLSDFNEQLLCG